MRHRPSPIELAERWDKILAVLAKGEASARQVCEGIGLRWPLELEKARGTLISMEKAGKVVRSVRPNSETRVAYYSLPNGDRQ